MFVDKGTIDEVVGKEDSDEIKTQVILKVAKKKMTGANKIAIAKKKVAKKVKKTTGLLVYTMMPRGSTNQRRMVCLILEFQAMATGEEATLPCMG